MIKRFFISLILAAACLNAVGAIIDYSTTYNYAFAPHSLLATGNWVKIQTQANGVYEISYDRLRDMGFNDPSKVRVYGKPGYLMPVTFVNNRGVRQVEDNLQPVPVMHSDGKMIFYAEGSSKIDFTYEGYDTSLHPVHTRANRSSFTDTSTWMLTDSHPGALVANTEAADRQGAAVQTYGFAYHYEDNDVRQGPFGNGPLFWGEEVTSTQPAVYSVTAPYCVSGIRAAVVGSYAQCMPRCDASLMFDLNGKVRSYSLASKNALVWTFDHNTSSSRMIVDENTHIGKADFKISVGSGYPGVIGIDYWSLSFPISLEYAKTDPDFSQQYISFAPAADGIMLRKHHIPAGCVAWDITDHADPVTMDSDGEWFYTPRTGTCEAVVFNPSARLMQPLPGFERVDNQDLHALGEEGAELLIVSTTQFLHYAERIAALHEQYDGIRVAIVTPQELFNEFSSGHADPMAYRFMTKLLYQSQGSKLKNALILGPVHGDYRNICGATAGPRLEGHPVFAQLGADLSHESAAILDFYGIVADRVIYPEIIDSARIRVGIGLLNVTSERDAELCVAKIEDYLKKEDFSGIVNETMAITCAGDTHIHDNQGSRLNAQYAKIHDDRLGSDMAFRQVWMEGAGGVGTITQTKDALNAGKLLTTYYGHAGNTTFGGLDINGVETLHNNEPGLLFIAGCSLWAPDNGVDGVGNRGVMGNRNGFIATIAATRSVLSNYNEDLATRFHTALIQDFDKKPRTQTPTIGEVYAQSKDQASNASEITYMLCGDPALTLPFPLTPVEMEVSEGLHRGGEMVEVTGRVVDMDHNPRVDFNGYVTVKALAPARSFDLRATGDTILKPVTVRDIRVVSCKGRVEAGHFRVTLPLPADADRYMGYGEEQGQSLRVLAGVYDPASRLAGSGVTLLPMARDADEQDPEAVRDSEAPVIDVAYYPELMAISVSVSDNAGLLPGVGTGCSVSLALDGDLQTLNSGISEHTAVTAWSGLISTAHLEEGEHAVKYRATDLAGNSTDAVTLKFNISHSSPMTLKAENALAIEEITFKVTGASADELELTVAAGDGTMLACKSFSGSSVTLDTVEIPAGHYRAAVRHNSGRGANVYSNWEEFTVID